MVDDDTSSLYDLGNFSPYDLDNFFGIGESEQAAPFIGDVCYSSFNLNPNSILFIHSIFFIFQVLLIAASDPPVLEDDILGLELGLRKCITDASFVSIYTLMILILIP